MLFWLFDTGQKIGLYTAVPAIVLGAVAPVVAAAMLKTEGRRSVQTASANRELHVRVAAAALAALGAVHVVVLVTSGLALKEGAGGVDIDFREALATWLVGPATYDRLRLMLAGSVVMVAMLAVAAAVMILTKDGGLLREHISSLRSPSRRRGEMGSARFCTPDQYQRFSAPDPEGLKFLGAFWGQGRRSKRLRRLDQGKGHFCLSAEDMARGVLTIGGPGSGKTQAVVLPAVADWMDTGHSVIVVDPQQELTDYVKRFAAVTGHRVVVHDPTSDVCPRFNLVTDIDNVSEARALADVLLPANQVGEAFWREAAQALLAACLLRFDDIGQILPALSDPRRLARRLAEHEDDARLLATPFIASVKENRQLATTMVTALATTLTGWADEVVRTATTTCDFTASTLVEHPTAVVLTCPGRQRAIYTRYLGAVLRKLMLDLDTIGERNGGSLPAPVFVVLDEFPTLGKLDGLVADVNLVRKRRMGVLIAAQTKGQFHLIYGPPATDALFAGLATQIIFGGCDQETANFYSQASGMTTWAVSAGLGQSPQVRQRPLLTPDEIQTPTRGNTTLLTRYVTEVYATQVMLFARLTRLYEREDWSERLASVSADDALTVERPQPQPDSIAA